jgi:hypothetical protein
LPTLTATDLTDQAVPATNDAVPASPATGIAGDLPGVPRC